MPIHHATVKRAASLGVVLTEEDGIAVAHHTERNRQIENEDPQAALAFVLIAAKLALEYPQITINDDGEASTEDVEGFYVIDPEAKLEDTFAELLEALPEDELGDEEEGTGTVVVADKYKKEYQARGDANNCGDWLAQFLKRYTVTSVESGKPYFDEAGFTAMLVANGVDLTGKWADLPNSGQRNWQGRYRMNGRQKLEVPVCRAGGVIVLEDGKTTVKMPADELDELLRTKHASLKEELEIQAEEAAQTKKNANKGGKK